MALKFNMTDFQDSDRFLINSFLTYMEENKLDFTLSYRKLPHLFNGDSLFYPEPDQLTEFVLEWKKRVKSVDQLGLGNPL